MVSLRLSRVKVGGRGTIQLGWVTGAVVCWRLHKIHAGQPDWQQQAQPWAVTCSASRARLLLYTHVLARILGLHACKLHEACASAGQDCLSSCRSKHLECDCIVTHLSTCQLGVVLQDGLLQLPGLMHIGAVTAAAAGLAAQQVVTAAGTHELIAAGSCCILLRVSLTAAGGSMSRGL